MSSLWIADEARATVESLHLLTVEDGWREDLPGALVNDRGDRQVVRLEHPGGEGNLYLKRWRIPDRSLYRWLPGRRALRSRAADEFRNLQALERIGIRVPRPLVFGETRGLWGTVASVLLLEGLDAYRCAQGWSQEHPGQECLIAEGIARIVGALHRHRIYYRSPGLKHFYVRADSPESPLALLDVPRLDPPAHPLRDMLGPTFGFDPPGPVRDLSKVLLTLRRELRLNRIEEEGFWAAYWKESGLPHDREAVRAVVERIAERRRERRKTRIDRARSRAASNP